MARIGVLALQGGFAPHAATLRRIGHTSIEVRTAELLNNVAGLILPGGESTTQLRLIEMGGLQEALTAFFATERPVLATCAGLILCARRVQHPAQRSFGLINVDVARNAWGRQRESFAATSDENDLPLMFIRAPRIAAVGPEVQVLATYRSEAVLVRQGHITAATFHPELTDDQRVHREVFGHL